MKNPIDLIERTPKDKLLHFSACIILGLMIKIAAQLAGLERPISAALIFVGVATAQWISEYLIQPTQPGRTARDIRDFLAGAAGGGVAAALTI